MTDKFDFDKIGKRMPYTMPPDTFSMLEANVLTAVKREKPAVRVPRWTKFAGIAVAASVALALVFVPTKATQADLLAQVDDAYAALSESDQDFLIDIYQEDIFLTQEQE